MAPPTSCLRSPTAPSEMTTSRFRASSRLAGSASISTRAAVTPSGLRPTLTQSSSSPRSFCSSSWMAPASLLWTRRTKLWRDGGIPASECATGGRGSAGAAGLGAPAATSGSEGGRTAGTLCAAIAGKRSRRRWTNRSLSASVSAPRLFGAPAAASASSSWGQPSGRGVKSTHLLSGIWFHQYLSTTKASLIGSSSCSQTIHPCSTVQPVAF
mmetsp:Transcript_98205/g.277970  ORF Transcript_98205/g.277970 Transcript_98205/m.277970 type:complete len:212 (+) Transcript_98205:3-638(+)